MNTTVYASVSVFVKWIGEELADVKRREVASIDAELLALKRRVWSEKLEQLRTDANAAAEQEKAAARQDHINRGLGNSTVVSSALRMIDIKTAGEIEKATREYTRGIEEVALLERKLEVQNRPNLIRRVLAKLGIR